MVYGLCYGIVNLVLVALIRTGTSTTEAMTCNFDFCEHKYRNK
jgi:hypothetical protein